MPGTFLKYFYLGAQLRALMDSWSWPNIAEYKDMIDTLSDGLPGYEEGNTLDRHSSFLGTRGRTVWGFCCGR